MSGHDNSCTKDTAAVVEICAGVSLFLLLTHHEMPIAKVSNKRVVRL